MSNVDYRHIKSLILLSNIESVYNILFKMHYECFSNKYVFVYNDFRVKLNL